MWEFELRIYLIHLDVEYAKCVEGVEDAKGVEGVEVVEEVEESILRTSTPSTPSTPSTTSTSSTNKRTSLFPTRLWLKIRKEKRQQLIQEKIAVLHKSNHFLWLCTY